MADYKVALITGATQGIGEAFADILPESTGLLLTGRDAGKLAELAERHARPGRVVETVTADLAEDAGRHAVIERAEALGIDLFVNNAGLGTFGPVIENDPGREREIVQVNVVAVHQLTQALLPGMVARAAESGARAGLIIVSSVVGYLAMPMMATYAATKAFDLRFAEALAEEVRREPVDVLALCPGATDTDFQQRSGVPLMFYRNAETAEAVARKGLGALGRRRMLLSRPVQRFGFGYQSVLQRVMMIGAGIVMRGQWRRT